MAKYFGTDGIRGEVNSHLINPRFAFKLGKILINYCRLKNLPLLIMTGRDTRASGSGLEMAFSRGVNDRGGKTISVGVITTPGLSYIVQQKKAGLAVMVSASHNPFEYNGFKIIKSNGAKPDDNEEAEIEVLISREANEPVDAVDLEKSRFGLKAEKNNRYIKNYINYLKAKAGTDLSGLRIVLDCANGSAAGIAPKIFKELGAAVETIAVEPDGKNINDKCGSQFTENLQLEVKRLKADLGLALDGDADRLIAVTEKGEVLNGDHLMLIYAKLLLSKGQFKNKAIVSTAMSNTGFIKAIEQLGIKHFISPLIGDRSVIFEMEKRGAILGGEEAGHIIFSEILKMGDGILSGLMLARAVKHFNKPLSGLAHELVLYPKILVNIIVKNKPDLESIPEIKEVIGEADKLLGQDGRVFVRYSGTEPLCRIMIEAWDENFVKKYTQKIAEVIKLKLG